MNTRNISDILNDVALLRTSYEKLPRKLLALIVELDRIDPDSAIAYELEDARNALGHSLKLLKPFGGVK